jgi:hypothetical protein
MPFYPAHVVLGQREDCTGYFEISSVTGQTATNNIGVMRAPSGTWNHLAYVYENTDLRTFMNGELSASGSAYGSLSSSSVNTTRLFNYFGGTIYYRGGNFALDDVRLYNRALSQDQVQRDMSTASGVASGIC